ncbi:hypothetical protein CJD36_002335 [Flavipsychrobacter stenotrophus]|uniref:Uncharacterized protein n=1 Tax=Flavipsychrobacter stenotrophus TaxID=2077091 RepID=A0A2S7T0W6_9BACT|nr:hypothetical protein [Flavipsychrobacter stenotrophus]PQJ12604.1 hypothetical protein CJD36_002335 [Flavipsychrobacter stenotrophus]
MFGKIAKFFKKVEKNKDILRNWRIPIDLSYERIDNDKSVQFTNADGSRVLYFSILIVKGNNSLLGSSFSNSKASIMYADDCWHLKGHKPNGNEVLVCVFTYTNEEDEAILNNLFDGIQYSGR